MKALLIDVGNSYLKWGVADDGVITRTGDIAQQKIRELGLSVLTSRLPRRVDAVMACNVSGPSFATRLAGVIGAHCDRDISFAKTQRAGYGVTNRYTQPRRMGVDRWVAMVGAWAELEDTCLIVDVGTAVTLDAIDENGQHLGGQIIPGVAAMANALSTSTSDIPSVRPLPAREGSEMQMFARNTAAAVREGARNAVVGAVDRAVEILQAEGYEPTTILTGGDASRILDALYAAPIHRPHLVLQGLAHMLESAQ